MRINSILSLLIAVHFSLLLTACGAPKSKITIAQNYEKTSEFAQAISVYEKLITEKPEKKIYYFLIGDNYLKLDNPEKAEEYYATALQNDADKNFVVDRIRLLAYYYSERGDYDKAIEILQKYREVDEEAIDFSIDKLHKQNVATDNAAKIIIR